MYNLTHFVLRQAHSHLMKSTFACVRVWSAEVSWLCQHTLCFAQRHMGGEGGRSLCAFTLCADRPTATPKMTSRPRLVMSHPRIPLPLVPLLRSPHTVSGSGHRDGRREPSPLYSRTDPVCKHTRCMSPPDRMSTHNHQGREAERYRREFVPTVPTTTTTNELHTRARSMCQYTRTPQHKEHIRTNRIRDTPSPVGWVPFCESQHSFATTAGTIKSVPHCTSNGGHVLSTRFSAIPCGEEKSDREAKTRKHGMKAFHSIPDRGSRMDPPPQHSSGGGNG